MKFIALLAICLTPLAAADPDWKAVEDHAVDLVRQYIRIASVNPPADTRATAALFKAELERNGLKPVIYAAGPENQTNLLVRIEGRDRTKKPLLLLNHFDVVPVDAKAWRVDPFAAEIQDGFIWGRGSLDMKGIGVQQLTALITMHNAGIKPSRDIVMLSTADEET
jgi:acetylornithine deacetylase/succinyl-diaminopimelate desuccinylase-like protein